MFQYRIQTDVIGVNLLMVIRRWNINGKENQNTFVLDTCSDNELHPGQTKAKPSVKIKNEIRYVKQRLFLQLGKRIA